MSAKAQRPVIDLLRERLQYIASQATQAKRFRPDDDRLLDLVDNIDNDVQEVIGLINKCRGNDSGEVQS